VTVAVQKKHAGNSKPILRLFDERFLSNAFPSALLHVSLLFCFSSLCSAVLSHTFNMLQ
jgi:hypothetical protein